MKNPCKSVTCLTNQPRITNDMRDILDEDLAKPPKKFKLQSFQSIEMIFLLPFAGGLAFKMMSWPYYRPLIALGALGLCLYYFVGLLLMEYLQKGNSSSWKYVLTLIYATGMSLALIAVGLKFIGGFITKYQVERMMIASTCINVFNYVLFGYLEKNSPDFAYFAQYQPRLVMIGGICLVYLLIPYL